MEEILKGLRYSMRRKGGRVDITLYNTPRHQLPELHKQLTALTDHPIITLFTAEEYLPQNLPNITEVI